MQMHKLRPCNIIVASSLRRQKRNQITVKTSITGSKSLSIDKLSLLYSDYRTFPILSYSKNLILPTIRSTSWKLIPTTEIR